MPHAVPRKAGDAAFVRGEELRASVPDMEQSAPNPSPLRGRWRGALDGGGSWQCSASICDQREIPTDPAPLPHPSAFGRHPPRSRLFDSRISRAWDWPPSPLVGPSISLGNAGGAGRRMRGASADPSGRRFFLRRLAVEKASVAPAPLIRRGFAAPPPAFPEEMLGPTRGEGKPYRRVHFQDVCTRQPKSGRDSCALFCPDFCTSCLPSRQIAMPTRLQAEPRDPIILSMTAPTSWRASIGRAAPDRYSAPSRKAPSRM